MATPPPRPAPLWGRQASLGQADPQLGAARVGPAAKLLLGWAAGRAVSSDLSPATGAGPHLPSTTQSPQH